MRIAITSARRLHHFEQSFFGGDATGGKLMMAIIF